MAYNSRNLLNKIVKIQDIVLREKARGATQIWVYDNLIADVYFISYDTFNKYLNRNAKRELELMDKREKENSRQLSIGF